MLRSSFGKGKPHHECYPGFPTVEGDVAAVCSDDILDDVESQAQSFGLGRDKKLPYIFSKVQRSSAAGIGHGKHRRVVVLSKGERQLSTIRHRLDSVERQI